MDSDEVKMPDLGERVMCSVVWWSLLGCLRDQLHPLWAAWPLLLLKLSRNAASGCFCGVPVSLLCLSFQPFYTEIHCTGRWKRVSPHAPYRSQVSCLSSW